MSPQRPFRNLPMCSFRNFRSAGLLATPAVCPQSDGIGVALSSRVAQAITDATRNTRWRTPQTQSAALSFAPSAVRRSQGGGTPKSLQIFLHSTSLISVWRGTADRERVAGLPHQECRAPSRMSSQPLFVRWDRNSRRFTPRSGLPQNRRRRPYALRRGSNRASRAAPTADFP